MKYLFSIPVLLSLCRRTV
uniref:Uncharacterized protein n=1 Tax=Anguilla anguilla TaxID=7936 RepID=A0A0E9R9K0_ANGAN